MTEPDRRARTRPAELLGLSAGIAVFCGLIVLMTTRDWLVAGIGFGIAFIGSLVTLAILVLAVNPVPDARPDAQDEDEPRGH